MTTPADRGDALRALLVTPRAMRLESMLRKDVDVESFQATLLGLLDLACTRPEDAAHQGETPASEAREAEDEEIRQAAMWRAFCLDAENGSFQRALLDDAENMGAGVLEMQYAKQADRATAPKPAAETGSLEGQSGAEELAGWHRAQAELGDPQLRDLHDRFARIATAETGSTGAWIAWEGGKCPVSAATLVEYQMRDGDATSIEPAGKLRWGHNTRNLHPDCEIVAYRIASPTQDAAHGGRHG